ncbi:hypothetical protein OCD70_22960 [Bacillus tropicus]|uniref:hypothetical protein n=1 Tax=Bacillus tropicus TaxID=2026188 RepID=UPI0021D2EF71|nr:hypothetical protein [Bacillus tropicus]MCU5002924.1 hypothetical protein [Bacillus tropicus]
MIEIKLAKKVIQQHKAFVLGANKSVENRLYLKLKNAMELEKKENIREILSFIFNNLETILIGHVKQLDRFKNVFDYMVDKIKDEKELVYLYSILEMFLAEYKYFYRSPGWNAYSFQKAIGITICPYCATQFIFLYESDTGKTRGTLDHFFDKATYPFLALSIYNLVPCCKVCNSDFKGKKNVELDTHYSPFEEGVIKYVRFKKEVISTSREEIRSRVIEHCMEKVLEEDIDYVAVFLGANDEFNLKIDYSAAPKDIQKKIKGNLDLFQLEEIYNTFHKPYVQSIIKKASIYNYTYRQQLINAYSTFFNNKEELTESLIPPITDDKKTILGKLTREIIEDETKGFTI